MSLLPEKKLSSLTVPPQNEKHSIQGKSGKTHAVC